MALTKSVAAVDEWQVVAQNTVVEGATVDLSANYQTLLTTFCVLSSETAQANGADIRVQISANTTGDEDWFDFVAFVGATGTGNKEDITNNPLAAASTTITCASTTGYTKPTGTDNGLRFIKDATVANSEVVLQNGLTTNTNITIVDGTTNEHANTADLYNIVSVHCVQLPDAANRCRVIYNNTKDAAGSELHVMSRISRITAI